MMSDHDDATSDDRVDGLRAARANDDTSDGEPPRPQDSSERPLGYAGGGVIGEAPDVEMEAETSGDLSDPKVGDVLATGTSPEGDPEGMQERTQAL